MVTEVKGKDRKQYYIVTNVKTGEVMTHHATSSDVAELFGMDIEEVVAFVNGKKLYCERYLMEKEGEIGDTKHEALFDSGFLKEWNSITRNLRNKILWCKPGTKGARKIILKA